MRVLDKVQILKINKDILKKIVSYPFILLLTLTISISAQTNIGECSTVYEVSTDQLNVRDHPNASGKIVGKVNKYDNVCVTGISGNWSQIENGWVSSKYIKDVTNIEVTKKHKVVQNVNNIDDAGEINMHSGNNSSDAEIQQDNQSADKQSNSYGLIALVLFVTIMAFIGFFLYNLFIHTLIALKLAEPDGRKKMGIRSTLLGRFVQGLLVFLLFLLFMFIGSINQ